MGTPTSPPAAAYIDSPFSPCHVPSPIAFSIWTTLANSSLRSLRSSSRKDFNRPQIGTMNAPLGPSSSRASRITLPERYALPSHVTLGSRAACRSDWIDARLEVRYYSGRSTLGDLDHHPPPSSHKIDVALPSLLWTRDLRIPTQMRRSGSLALRSIASWPGRGEPTLQAHSCHRGRHKTTCT